MFILLANLRSTIPTSPRNSIPLACTSKIPRPAPASDHLEGQKMDAQMNRLGHWGPVTATLDWCEVRMPFSRRRVSSPFTFCQANYQFSHYVAEISNTFSNLFFIWISIYGAQLFWRESLPTRYLIGYAVRPSAFITPRHMLLIPRGFLFRDVL